jgi:hypothetical protein
MSPRGVGLGTITAAVELACRAPSVRNTQPWLWRWSETELHLRADRSRQLPSADPEGRDLVISCGAALHHVRLALAALDVVTVVRRLPDPADLDHLATLELHPSSAAAFNPALAGAIGVRRTDRRRFADRPVPEAFENELITIAADEGAALLAVTDAAMRELLLDAIAEADRLGEAQLRSGAFAGRVRGAETASRFATGLLDQPDIGGDDGATLFVLGTHGDDPGSWLHAGEATSAVLLIATELGLATSVLTQALEIGPTRKLIADEVLSGALHPQLIVRVGWTATPAGPPLTPRRSVEDVLAPLRS